MYEIMTADEAIRLTIVSSAGFGDWEEEHNAEGYIRESTVRWLFQ